MDRRAFMAMTMTSSLVACGPRGVFSPAVADLRAAQQPIFVVTDRVVDSQLTSVGGRAENLTNARVNVQIPESHETGQIEYPQPGRDNSQNFGVESAYRYARQADLLHEISRYGDPSEDLVVYVHGYNNNLAEAVYRHAQIAHDFGLRGPQITFSWSSSAEPLGYAYDRDSISVARDRLEQLIISLASNQRRRIVLLAHSLGSTLLTEVLRQMAIGGKAHLFRRFALVALMSPDIDVDVFRSQVRRIQPLPQPFVIFVSKTDRALRLSAGITGKSVRLGSTDDIAELQGLGFTIFDLSTFADTAPGDHFAAVSSATGIAMLRGIWLNGIPEVRADQPRPNLAGIFFETTAR